MFVIQDEFHLDLPDDGYATLEDAVTELKRWAEVPWDHKPNQAPCTSWRTCGRRYAVIEYDVERLPWKELSRIDVLEVSAAGVTWLHENL